MAQLLDFIVNNLESHYEKWCLDFADVHYNKNRIFFFIQYLVI